jgi:protoporphyrinogen oxidase
VILGAGLTGLAAAARLEELGESDYLLVEKEDRPGGWATTDWTGEYGADKGVHVLYFRDDGVRRHVEELLGGRWIRHEKRCVVDSGGIRTPFPFHANLHGRPPEVVEECVAGLRIASADQRTPAPPATFLEWILHTYGPGVARHFMVPYNSKMWTVPPESMSADWMGGFIPPVDLERSLEGASSGRDSRVGLNAQFFYPEMGISTLAEEMSSRLHGSIRYGAAATRIAAHEKSIHMGDRSVVSFDTVISTIPLPRAASITDGLSSSAMTASRSLIALDLVLVDIGVRRPRDGGVHWAYLPDADVLAYRINAVHNLTDRMSPSGHGLYIVEIAHSPHRPLPDGSITRRTIADLIRSNWLGSESDVTFVRERRLSCAYALPLIGSARCAASVRRSLEALDIHSIGRYGEWKYANMEDAFIDGRAAADRLIGASGSEPR